MKSKQYYQSQFACLLAGFLLVVSAQAFGEDQPAPVTPAVVETQNTAEKNSYVYDLKSLIEKSKNNIKRVNEKIKEQAVQKRNQQREEKAREYYDRAMELFEEGRISEARELFEKSIRITEHPEMKDYIKVSEKKFKSQEKAMRKEESQRIALTAEQERERQQQVQNAYADGVRLFKEKNYKASRDEFMLVEQLIPEYKAARSYLKLLEERIAQQDQVDLVNQKKEMMCQQKEAEGERVKEKEMWRKELELKEAERERKLNEQAKKVYSEAVQLHKEKKFIAAKEKFQEVEWVLPDYKSTRRYLEQLDRDIKDSEQVFAKKEEEHRAKQEWEDELTRKKAEAQTLKEFEAKSTEEKQKAAVEAAMHYQRANDLMAEKKYTEARDEFLAVQNIYPNFKATDTYLARLNHQLGIIETAPEQVIGQVREIYAQGVAAYKEKDYGAAKLKFEQVEFMYPDYMATRKYLGRLSKVQDLPSSEFTKEAQSSLEQEDIQEVGKPVDDGAYRGLIDQADPLYKKAIALFEEKKYEEALKEFEAVEALLPNYLSTRPYLKRVNHQIKREEQQRYKEEQTKQAETINELAKQANVLYTKISQLADDRSTSEAQRKFAMIDRLFANMSKEQARLLEEIAQEEEKLRLEEIAYEQEVQRSEFANVIDPIYQEAVRLYQARKYDEAKSKFLEAQSKIADYRSSNRYLSLIEKQNQLLQQTIKDRESKIVEFQQKAAENAELAAKLQLKAQESAMIKDLVGQAEAINEEIVALSKDRNFAVIKEKFAALEKIVDNLLTIKMAAMAREEQEKQSKDNAPRASRKESSSPESKIIADETPKPAQVPNQEIKPVPEDQSKESVQPNQTTAPAAETISKTKDHKEEQDKEVRARLEAKRIEIEKKQEADERLKQEQEQQKEQMRQLEIRHRDEFKLAVQSFKQKNYTDAKARFIQLETSPKFGDAARNYLFKMDAMLLEEQNRQIQRQDKEREDYLKQRTDRERMSYQIKESHRNNVIQTAPMVKMQSPAVVPTPQYPVTRQQYLSSLSLRVKNPALLEIANQNQVAEMRDVPPVNSLPPVPPAGNPPVVPPVSTGLQASPSNGMSPNEDGSWIKRRKQKRLSEKRKQYIEAKQKAEEKRQEELKKREEQKQEQERQQKEILQKKEAQRLEEQRKKSELRDQKTSQRRKAERQARVMKAQEIREQSTTIDKASQRLKQATNQDAQRHKEQEKRLRRLYQQELRGTKSESGFNEAMVQLEAENKKKNRELLEKQKSFLRKDREEEKKLLLEKERKLNTLINQGQAQENRLRSKKKSLPKTEPPVISASVEATQSFEVAQAQPVEPPKTTIVPQELPAEQPITDVLEKTNTPAERATVEETPKEVEAKYTVKVTKEKISPKPRKAKKKPAAKKDKQESDSTKDAKVKAAAIHDKDELKRKFENGLAKMYAEAIAYYRKHLYQEARNRFSDVEDIAPDYKRTRFYLARIQDEIIKEQKRREKLREDRQYNAIQNVDAPRIRKLNDLSAPETPPPAAPVNSNQASEAPAENRLDAVNQALDAIEGNTTP